MMEIVDGVYLVGCTPDYVGPAIMLCPCLHLSLQYWSRYIYMFENACWQA